jgi:hypothetical protein
VGESRRLGPKRGAAQEQGLLGGASHPLGLGHDPAALDTDLRQRFDLARHLPDEREPEAAGDTGAGEIRLLVEDPDPLDTGNLERRTRRRLGGFGRVPLAGAIDMDPVPDLEPADPRPPVQADRADDDALPEGAEDAVATLFPDGPLPADPPETVLKTGHTDRGPRESTVCSRPASTAALNAAASSSIHRWRTGRPDWTNDGRRSMPIVRGRATRPAAS